MTAVLVTGGSSGLGAAVVDAVAKAGGRPYVIDRQPPADGVPWVQCDLADTRAAEEATAAAGRAGRRASTAWSPRPASTCPGGWPTCRRRRGSGSSRSTCSPPRPSSGRRCPALRTRAAARSSPSPRRSASRRSATPPPTARPSSASSASPGRWPPNWPGTVGVTLLIPGGMRTAFFDDRDPQYQPGAGRRPQRPGQRRRRGPVRAEPAARLRGPRDGRLRRPGDVVPVILALRALGVGDLATAVPALRGLRAAYPDQPTGARRAARGWRRWSTCVGGVDRVLPIDGLAPRALPCRPDVAVNLHGRGPESHRLLLASEPGELLAFACPDVGHPRRSGMDRGGTRGDPVVPAAALVRHRLRPRRPRAGPAACRTGCRSA